MSGRPNKEENSSGGVGLLGGILLAGVGAIVGAVVAVIGSDIRHGHKDATQRISSNTFAPPVTTPRRQQSTRAVVSNVVPQGITCMICSENPREIILEPCNHTCVCEDCAQINLGPLCPICRTNIISKRFI